MVTPYGRGTKVCLNGPADMTKMGATITNSKHPLKTRRSDLGT